jgi:hypothetical protein
MAVSVLEQNRHRITDRIELIARDVRAAVPFVLIVVHGNQPTLDFWQTIADGVKNVLWGFARIQREVAQIDAGRQDMAMAVVERGQNIRAAEVFDGAFKRGALLMERLDDAILDPHDRMLKPCELEISECATQG